MGNPARDDETDEEFYDGPPDNVPNHKDGVQDDVGEEEDDDSA